MKIVITGEGEILMHNRFSTEEAGYNKQEVMGFIDEVITVLDELNREHKKAMNENQLLRDQLGRFDEIKEQIKDILLTAQTVASDIKTQALQEQSLILDNAHQEARKVVTEKLNQANKLDHEISIYKARLRSIITSQLEMLKEIDE